MARAQNSPRGLLACSRLDVGSQNLTFNSTGVIASGAIYPSAGLGGKITADSTAVIVTALKIGAWSTGFTVDSTGVLLGTKYITGNSTGN